MDLREAESRVEEMETAIAKVKEILLFATSKPKRMTVRDDQFLEF